MSKGMQGKLQIVNYVRNMTKNLLTFYLGEANHQIVAEEHEHGKRPERVLELSLEKLKQRDPAELRHAIGRLVISFLNSRSKNGLDLPRDLEDTQKLDTEYERWEAEQSKELERQSAAGDVTAKRELAMQTIAQGLRTKSKKLMNKADQLLREADSAGDAKSAEYLADFWPALKERSDKTFQ